MKAGDEPAVVGEAIVAAATDTHPKLRYPAGTLARRVSKLRRYVPSALFDRQIRKTNQLNRPTDTTVSSPERKTSNAQPMSLQTPQARRHRKQTGGGRDCDCEQCIRACAHRDRRCRRNALCVPPTGRGDRRAGDLPAPPTRSADGHLTPGTARRSPSRNQQRRSRYHSPGRHAGAIRRPTTNTTPSPSATLIRALRPARAQRPPTPGRDVLGLDIGARTRGSNPTSAIVVSQRAARRRAARRPDRLAVYMGCCPHRREGSVRFGTLPSPAPMRTPDRGLVLAAPGGRLPKIV